SRSAALAIAQDSPVAGADVCFKAGVVDFLERLTSRADQGEYPELSFARGQRWKLDLPELQLWIKEGNSVGESVVAGTKLADYPNVSFLVSRRPAQHKLLFRRKLVFGSHTGAMEAEQHGVGALRENFALQIGADEEDRDLLGDAAAPAHALLWQPEGQRRRADEPI